MWHALCLTVGALVLAFAVGVRPPLEEMCKPVFGRVARVWPDSMHPNAITLIGGAFVILAYSATSRGAYGWGAVAHVAYVFADNTDGCHARRTGQSSALGHMLDHMIDGTVGCWMPWITLTQVLFHMEDSMASSVWWSGSMAILTGMITVLWTGNKSLFADLEINALTVCVLVLAAAFPDIRLPSHFDGAEMHTVIGMLLDAFAVITLIVAMTADRQRSRSNAVAGWWTLALLVWRAAVSLGLPPLVLAVSQFMLLFGVCLATT